MSATDGASLQKGSDGSDLLALDLQISAFAAAVRHSRRFVIAKPFPTAAVTGHAPQGGPTPEPAMRACQALVSSLPRLSTLTTDELLRADPDAGPASDSSLTTDAIRLLQWIAARPRARRKVQLSSWAALTRDVGEGKLARVPPNLLPDYVFALGQKGGAGPGPPATGESLSYAFHGTSFENLHSILAFGLIDTGDARMMSTGQIFGRGVYMARDYETAFGFSAATDAWRNSSLGCRLRCMLVARFPESKVSTEEGARPSDVGATDHYIIVQDVSAIELTHVLVFVDQGPLPAGGGDGTAAVAAAGDGAWSTAALIAAAVVALVAWIVGGLFAGRSVSRIF
ncbi:unnamed protein product [Pedinophyceae sp. YPF-701]|nr:unnamed protein product [Pedinophyceae sp. YPF-701]